MHVSMEVVKKVVTELIVLMEQIRTHNLLEDFN